MGFYSGIDCVECIPVLDLHSEHFANRSKTLGPFAFLSLFLLKAPRDNVKWCIIFAVIEKRWTVKN